MFYTLYQYFLKLNKTILLSIILISIFKAEAQTPSALKVGDSLFALGDYSKAIKEYKKGSENEVQLFKLAQTYKALGNISQAIHYYEAVLLLDSKNAMAQYNYGKLLTDSGNYKKADSIFNFLIKTYPENPNFLYQLGLLKEEQSDSTAINYYQQAYQLDNDHLNSLYKIAKRHLEKRKFNEVRPFIEKGLIVNENSIQFLNLKALLEYYTQDYHKAIAAYLQLIKLNQSNPQLHENLAKSYMNTYQIEKAIKQFTILINEYEDKNPSWHFQIGKAFKLLHYTEKAKRHIEISIALLQIPLDTQYMSLASIYKREKDYNQEMEMLRNALNENPENELAQYQLAVAADNYFEDKESVMQYYETYLKKYSETGKMQNLAKQRISDLKKELHYTKD